MRDAGMGRRGDERRREKRFGRRKKVRRLRQFKEEEGR
jgi:hypothetical protein